MLPTAFEALAARRYDCMILDATFGADAQLYRIPGGKIFFYHNNTTMLQMLRTAFLNAGCADSGTVFVADHLARTYFPDGERARMDFQPLGYLPAYDGMTLELSYLRRSFCFMAGGCSSPEEFPAQPCPHFHGGGGLPGPLPPPPPAGPCRVWAGSVSYTHLDLYKRQMCSSLAFKKTHPAVKSELKTLFEKTRAGKVQTLRLGGFS